MNLSAGVTSNVVNILKANGLTPGMVANLRDASEPADDDLIFRDFGFEIDKTSIDLEARTARFIFSSETVDSYGEIVKQDWEKRIGRYKKTPIVLYGHNRSVFFDTNPRDTLPIGYCLEIGVVNGRLQGLVKFVTAKANEMAERVWQSVIEGSLRATSVGFFPHTIKYETIDDVERIVLSDNELFEISIVPMGANPDAVLLSANRAKQYQRLLALAKGEVEMTISEEQFKKMQSELEASKKEAADLQVRLASVEGTATAASQREKELAEQLAAERKRVEDVEVRAKASEAQALVGKKILPTQVTSFIKLSCNPASAEDFKEFVEKMPDLNLTDPQIPPEGVKAGDAKSVSAFTAKVLDAYNAGLKEDK